MLGFVSLVLARRLAGKIVFELTRFVRVRLNTLTQSWSAVGTIAVHYRATYLLDIRRPGVLRLCASCLEQPPTAHKTYLFHGRLLTEFEILSVFVRFLTHVFNLFTVFYVFIFTCSAPLLCFVSFTVP